MINDTEVKIKGFKALIPEQTASSPLDVPFVKANITTKEIVDIVRKGRER